MGSVTGRLALPYPVGADTPDVPRDISALTTKLEALVDPTPVGLPATPYDGQVAYLRVTDVTPSGNIDGKIWAFRYRAGSSSAFKWEFIGGPPMMLEASAAFIINPTTANLWVDDASQPTLTIPRQGEYVIADGAFVQSASSGPVNIYQDVWYTPPAGTLTQLSRFIVLGATALGDAASLSLQTDTGPYLAGTVLKTRGMADTAGRTVSFSLRWLSLLPVRVA